MKHQIIHLNEFFSILGNDECDPTLTIYMPYNMAEMHREEQKRPCLLICPGGGYAMCSEREAEPIALHFLPEGFNVFILNYSVAPHRFPTQIREVAAAVEFIHRNADEWNCDQNKVAIIGFSAGGHLAAHYSTMYDCMQVREVFPQSKPVNATVLCYPVITADPHFGHVRSFDNLIGRNNRTEEENYLLSCECHVTAQTPPTFLWHTAEDNVVPVVNSLLYGTALANAKVPFEMHIYPYGAHGLSTCDAETIDAATLQNAVSAQQIAQVGAWLPALNRWFSIIGFHS